MSQDLIEKIRAAAQAKGIDPEVAVRIATAESGLKPGVSAKTSSGAGLFGVIDSTWKGFGGKPGMKLDPDENIRVGTDVIAKNSEHLKNFLKRDPRPAEIYAAHYFGPAGVKGFLSADPSTPMESLFPEYVITANPNLKGKTAGQVMATLEKKMGGKPAATATASVPRETPAATPPARAAGEPRTAEAAPVAPRIAAEVSTEPAADKLASLGPSYQAALALTMLADTDDEKGSKDIDNEPSIAEKWLAESGTKPTAFAELNDIKIRSPFPDLPKPQMLAEGGEVEEQEDDAPMRLRMQPREDFYTFKGGHKNQSFGQDQQSGDVGVDVPIGEGNLRMAANINRMTMGQKSDTARAMLASLRYPVGEGQVQANLIKPFGPGTEGVYVGDIGGSYPVGEGQLSVSRQFMQNPYERGFTGYNVGYGGKVGPGFLSGGVNIPDHGRPQGRIEYRLPIGRADGGTVERMTAQQIERAVAPAGEEVAEPNVLSVPTYSRTVSYEMYPGQSGQFDQRDAARHMLAAGTLARKYGTTAAEMMGNLHEITTSPLRWAGSKLGISEMPVDYEQDLHNNRLGAQLGARSKSQKELEDLVQQMAERAHGKQTEGRAWIGKPVRRNGGGEAEPTPEEIEAASRPATVNPNIRKQGEAARRLAAMRDVNTLPDPRTYAAVSGFLGTAPDEQGFSAMHPDIEGIKKAGEAGFYAGTAAQVAPIVGGAMKIAKFGPSSGGTSTAAQQLGAIKTPGRVPEPIFQHIPSAEAPFVGRLDEFVSNLPGAVQKDQFLGMLKGKFRDYDIGRAEETLADLPGNAKLSPVDLLNRIKSQYDPGQFKTMVIPPGKPGVNYQSMDNIYFDKASGAGEPLGVIHLSQNIPPEVMQQQQLVHDAGLALSRVATQASWGEMPITIADELVSAVKNPSIPLSESTASQMLGVARDYRDIAAKNNEWEKAKQKVLYPILQPEYAPLKQQHLDSLMQQNPGMGEWGFYREADIRAAQQLAEEANQWLRSNGHAPAPLPDYRAVENPLIAVMTTPAVSREVTAAFDAARGPILEGLKDLKPRATAARQAFGDDTRSLSAYMGQHTSLGNPPSPISFSRFSEHTTDIPGFGKADGIYVNELQSDLLDDLRKTGSKGGSLEKDEKALREVEVRIKATRDPIEFQALESQARRLRSRLSNGTGPNMMPKEGFYQLPESFAGMENSPQVAQQLMVKNAVSGAMQMGKQFVAFPGAESAQAQLYEKLGPNLKSVVKDLGPGFELRDVTLRDPNGNPIMHRAIVWGPEAAARLQKKGVPFKDGGAVERQTADHRKYL